MNIECPKNFDHAGELPRRYADRDPRTADFHETTVDIDLRNCEFVQPAAVLWCLVYSLLASSRGSICRLLVPNNMGVCVYLKSVGLFDLLNSQGVEADDRDVFPSDGGQIILPVTEFRTETDVEDLANLTLDKLQESSLGAPNIRPVVSEIFAELALNAVQHSRSGIGAFGLVQFYRYLEGNRFVCAVCDGGIGIRSSLQQNPSLRQRATHDWNAIELAMNERISGTGEPYRGIGLYGIAEEVKNPGRQLIIHSGQGLLQLAGPTINPAQRAVLFPGTLAVVTVRT